MGVDEKIILEWI